MFSLLDEPSVSCAKSHSVNYLRFSALGNDKHELLMMSVITFSCFAQFLAKCSKFRYLYILPSCFPSSANKSDT